MQSGRDVSRIEKNRENGQLTNNQQARNASAAINGQLIETIGDNGARSIMVGNEYAKAKQAAPRGQANASRYTIGH